MFTLVVLVRVRVKPVVVIFDTPTLQLAGAPVLGVATTFGAFSKGVAKVTVPQSVLSKLKVGKKITYQATYLKDIVKKTVKVRK